MDSTDLWQQEAVVADVSQLQPERVLDALDQSEMSTAALHQSQLTSVSMKSTATSLARLRAWNSGWMLTSATAAS